MSNANANLWKKARQGRDQLVKRLMSHQAVRLIDIGEDPENPGEPERIALRVHLRRPLVSSELEIPQEINGVPVRILIGDYQLD